ncbi:cytochrome P450 2C23-like [Physella acuta]|uniref:cytochrome P450 2C23-like n=1 Tax=Physella acuta TaxID=109671 RepID=UPI0027DD797D|nr:cytochrome P450 2C23-like [Physella acuta]XP_059142372.1 cytochrome P450 2C23-like [Physella acuta]
MSYPPGPKGLPIVGSLLSYKDHRTSLQWTKEFGPFYCTWMGLQEMAYFNSIELVEGYMEGEVGELMLGRPEGPLPIGQGLLFGSGENWEKNRIRVREALEHPRFKSKLEEVIHHELGIALQKLDAQLTPDPMRLGDVFLEPCVYVVAGVLLGDPVPLDSEDRRVLLSIAQDMFQCNFRSFMTQFSLKCPMTAKLVSTVLFTELVDLQKTISTLRALIRKWVKAIRQRATAKDSPATKLDEASAIYSMLKDVGFHESTEENEAELVMTMNDMFFAGTTTVQSAFEFTLMYLSKYTQHQQRAREEVDRVAGSGPLSWAMKERMPFVWACVLEGLRLATLTPSTIPHVLTQEVKVNEYTLRKGTYGIGSMCSLHRDERFFPSPEVFYPERHLDGQNIRDVPSYRPYGIGRRKCIGWDMADVELFLYTASVLRRYVITSADDTPPQDMEVKSLICCHLKDFRCFVEKR